MRLHFRYWIVKVKKLSNIRFVVWVGRLGIYTIGRDIGRFAYINANKDLLKKLNEAIQKDKHMLAVMLAESGREQRTKMQLGEMAVSVADRNYEKGLRLCRKEKMSRLFYCLMEHLPAILNIIWLCFIEVYRSVI